MANWNDVVREVAENSSAVDGFLAYHSRVVAELRANATDPAAIQALADDLEAQQKRLADAMVVNTPADQASPAPTPADQPGPTLDAPPPLADIVNPPEGQPSGGAA